MEQRFIGQSAVVTGASGGIGRATALAFAREGASVTLIDRFDAGLQETLRLIEGGGGRGLAIGTDVSDEAAVRDAFARATGEFGRFHLAVNGAGVAQSAAMTAEIPLDQWTHLLNVNVIGLWLCMREELRHMEKQGGGAIVNIASFAGLRSLMLQSAYVASKHAVIGLTRNAAVEYAAAAIRINAAARGGVSTPMMEQSLAGLDLAQRSAATATIESFHPMRRIGQAEEIAQAILFLCSDQASFMTGSCVSVDGGWSAT